MGIFNALKAIGDQKVKAYCQTCKDYQWHTLKGDASIEDGVCVNVKNHKKLVAARRR